MLCHKHWDRIQGGNIGTLKRNLLQLKNNFFLRTSNDTVILFWRNYEKKTNFEVP